MAQNTRLLVDGADSVCASYYLFTVRGFLSPPTATVSM